MLTKEIILIKYPKYSDIKEIKKLNIWGEDLQDISILSKMKNLEILSLSSNKISNLSPLSNCLNIREIYLRNNNINSFNELYYLQNLQKLKVLWLEGNPISKDKFYFKKVLNILPNLHYLDNKTIKLHMNAQKRGQSEEQKIIKNKCDCNTNISKSNRKKILLRRVFSYFEPSNDYGGCIESSNEVSLANNNKKDNKYNIKKVDLSEFKIKFSTKGKSAKKERKNFKKIKLKIKNDNKVNYNLYNHFMINNNLGNGPRISCRKLTVDTNPNPKPIIRDSINVQNSIIHQNSSDYKEKIEFKNKKLSFLGNKDIHNENKYRYKNDDKISININNYENENNSNLIKAVYLLVDKLNIQDLMYLKEVINKRISILTK